MIEVIVAVVGGSLTAITCSSLWFASVMDKRERKDVEDERAEEERERHANDPESAVKIYPFEFVTVKTACQLCGAFGDDKRGPKMPQACQNGSACPAHLKEHIHMECMTCKGKWFMKPRIVVK